MTQAGNREKPKKDRQTMKRMRKAAALLLALLCLLPLGAAAHAENAQTRAVIGADLTEEQIASVYQLFGKAAQSASAT